MGKLLACGVVAALALSACGGAPPAQAPEIGSLAIAPPAPSVSPAAPAAVARPENVLAWVRFDDADALLDLAGVTAQSLGQSTFSSEVVPYFEALETHRPIDVVVVAVGKHAKDVEVAARFGLRDAKAFFHAVSKHFDVAEQGERVIVRKQTPRRDEHERDGEPEGDVVMVCELAGTNAERATCGTEAAMESIGEWLRGGPEPRAEDSVRSGDGAPMARAVLFGNALRRVLSAHDEPRSDSTERALLDLLDDVDVFSVSLAREDKELSFVLGARLRSATSKIAHEMLAKTNDDKPGDPFFRIWQEGSAVVFTPGGGPLPAWVTGAADGIGMRARQRTATEPSATAKAIGKVLEKPVTIGYGVRLDRAKSALAAVRAAKDPEKAAAALERALEPYLVYSVGVDVGVAEKHLRDLAVAWTAESEEYERTYHTSYPATRHAVRAAPAKLGLPKGSFFFDTTSADFRHYTSGGAPVKTKTEHVVHVPIAGATWGLSCADEKSCADGAKKLLAPATGPRRALNPMFERKGIAFAGYLSSLVGAFTMHRASLGAAANGVPNDALAELEHDLASPRLDLPFVVTSEQRGEGGAIAFEMRGDPDAFKVLAEHAGMGGNMSLGLLVYAAMMMRH